MAKLYWRVKVGGVWTYKAATVEYIDATMGYHAVRALDHKPLRGEEE